MLLLQSFRFSSDFSLPCPYLFPLQLPSLYSCLLRYKNLFLSISSNDQILDDWHRHMSVDNIFLFFLFHSVLKKILCYLLLHFSEVFLPTFFFFSYQYLTLDNVPAHYPLMENRELLMLLLCEEL